MALFEGQPTSQIWIVGENWTRIGLQQKRAFTGDAEMLLKALLKQKGFSLEKICFTNLFEDPSLGKHVPSSTMLKATVDLKFHISQYKPKVVITCGTVSVKALVAKTTSLAELRGVPYWNDDCKAWILPTLHPQAVTYSPDSFYDLSQDLGKIPQVMDYKPGQSLIPKLEVIVIRTMEEALKHEDLLDHPEGGYMSVDIETSGFDFLYDKILSIGVGPADEVAVIFAKEFIENCENAQWLNEKLSNPEIEYDYQNGKFDVKFMRSNPNPELYPKKKCVLSKVRCDFDTMMAHYNVDERQGTHGLKVWAKEEFNAPDWDAPLKKYLPTKDASFELIPEDELYRYQAYDIYYTRRGRTHFKNKMIEEGTLECFEKVHMPAVEAFAQLELEGIPIDYQRLKTMFEEGQPRIEQAKKKLRDAAREMGFEPQSYAKMKDERKLEEWQKANLHLPAEQRAKMPGKTEVPKFFNPNSHPQLSYVAYELCENIPLFDGKMTCNKDAVDIYRHRHPFWRVLAEYKEVNDLFGTFIKGMIERVNPDNRIRPDFLLHGTKTGRISCTNPNMQNLPRGSEIKDFFVADEGCIVVNADYKTLEVVIAAILSDDPDMKRPFIEGLDFHSETARAVFAHDLFVLQTAVKDKDARNIIIYLERTLMLEIRSKVTQLVVDGKFEEAYEEIWQHLRFLTKFITFGIMYGRGAQSLALGELNCSVMDAVQYVETFFNRYPKYKAWLDTQFNQAKTEGFVQNIFGFKRRWPFITRENLHEIKNQSWNTPIQGSASMVCMQALCRTQAKLKERGWGRALFTVHDSIVYSISIPHLQQALTLIHQEMTKDVIETDVKLDVDLEIGSTYKRIKKVVRHNDGLWYPKDDNPELAKVLGLPLDFSN